MVFHIGWNGGFSRSLKNPIGRIPIAHNIADPHFGNGISEAYSSPKSYYRLPPGFSGIYNWLYTSRFNTVFHVYNFVITHEFFGVSLIAFGNLHFIYSCRVRRSLALNLPVGGLSKPRPTSRLTDIKVHPIFIWPSKFFLAYFHGLRLTSTRLPGDVGRGIIAPLSGAFGLHLEANNLGGLHAFQTGDWLSYHSRILTFLGGLKWNTFSLYLTDIAHHHFGVALLFLWQRGLMTTLYKSFPPAPSVGCLPSVYLIIKCRKSLHLHLSLGLLGLSLSIAGVHPLLTILPPYLYLSMDILASSGLHLHHSSIALFLMIGSFAHAGIFLIRECSSLGPKICKDLIGRILRHAYPVLSHLT